MGTLDKHIGYRIDDVFKSNALVDIRACSKPVVKVKNSLKSYKYYMFVLIIYII